MSDKKNESGLHVVSLTTARQMTMAHIMIDMPIFLHGSPGTIKSAMVYGLPEWAKKHSRLDKPLFVWDAMRLSQVESIDLRGLTIIKDNATVSVAPEELPTPEGVERMSKRLGIDLSKYIIVMFFDEIGQGMPSVQAACMQLIHERRIGSHRLAPNVRIVACTNLASDRSGVSNLLGALANRATNLQLEPTCKEWLEWAENEGKIRFEIINFLRFNEAAFYRYDKSRLINTTARSWERVSHLINEIEAEYGGEGITGGGDALVAAACLGNLDKGAATEFTGFCQHMKELKGLNKLFTDPMKAPLPKDSAAASYLACGYISYAYNPGKKNYDNLDNAMTYIGRMDGEFQALAIKDLKFRHKSFGDSKQYKTWCENNVSWAKKV